MLLDPVEKLGNARVHSRLVWLGAVAAKTDDALQPPSVVDVAGQRTAGVATARVLAAVLVAGTEHVIGDEAAVEGRLTALGLCDDWHLDLSKNWRPVARSYRVQRTNTYMLLDSGLNIN